MYNPVDQHWKQANWRQHSSITRWVCFHLSSPFIHHHLHCSTALSMHTIEDSGEEQEDISENQESENGSGVGVPRFAFPARGELA